VTMLRLTIEIAGQTVYGVGFSSKTELDQFIAANRGLPLHPLPPPTQVEAEPRHGRPSFDAAIAEAF
jgi:hypothetical protein